MEGLNFSPNAVLGILTWCMLLFAALHSLLFRKKMGASFIGLHLMDVVFAFVFATAHGGLILARILQNGWPLQLGSILGLTTWCLVFLALIFGIFRQSLSSALKKAYMPIHILIGVLAFAVATTHGIIMFLGKIL
jgi:hypothetical protein